MNRNRMRPALPVAIAAMMTIVAGASRAGTPTTVPSDRNFKARPTPNSECAVRVGAAIGRPLDVLFLGDSITQGFGESEDGHWVLYDDVILPSPTGDRAGTLVGLDVWQKHYAGRHVLNAGVGADGTEHILWRLQMLPFAALRPKVVVLLAGTNDTTFAAADVAAGVGAVVARSLAIFPGARVIVVSILPNARAPGVTADANALIAKLADGDRVYYLDVASRMIPSGAGWRGIGDDRLHLTPEGYEIWATAMEPLLTRLLATATSQP